MDDLDIPRPLRGQVALVAGGSGGIGSATARQLGVAGARVVIAARDVDRLTRARDLLEASGIPDDHLLAVPTDLADPTASAGAVTAALETFGRLDVLVNAAGSGVFKSFPQLELQELIDVVESNLFTALFVTHHAMPALIRARGHVIHIGSGLGRRTVARGTAYCAAKFGLHAFSDALRRDVARYGVGVTLVSPAGAGVDTPFWDTADPNVKRAGMLPPERVAEVVLSVLTSPERTLIDDITVRPR